MPSVLLLLYPGFSEFEVTVALAVVRARYRLVTVAPDARPLTSEAGLRVVPDCTPAEVVPADHAALIVPGGEDLSAVLASHPVLDLVRAMDRDDKLLAAICAGPLLLARAGVLVGHPYTVSLYRRHRDAMECFEEEGFRYEPIVEEGHVVTAQGFAFVEFGLRIGARLGALRDAEAVQAYYRGQGDLRWEG